MLALAAVTRSPTAFGPPLRPAGYRFHRHSGGKSPRRTSGRPYIFLVRQHVMLGRMNRARVSFRQIEGRLQPEQFLADYLEIFFISAEERQAMKPA